MRTCDEFSAPLFARVLGASHNCAADKTNAKVLYERFGFAVEGVQRRGMRMARQYFDAYTMALLL